jgi:hypothetical protein
MLVKVLAFSRSPKPSVLASVRVELAVEGDSIIIDDARILKNKLGEHWLAMPSYSIQLGPGRGYDYQPAVILSGKLKRSVEDCVLSAFEKWQSKQSAPAQDGGQ